MLSDGEFTWNKQNSVFNIDFCKWWLVLLTAIKMTQPLRTIFKRNSRKSKSFNNGKNYWSKYLAPESDCFEKKATHPKSYILWLKKKFATRTQSIILSSWLSLPVSWLQIPSMGLWLPNVSLEWSSELQIPISNCPPNIST